MWSSPRSLRGTHMPQDLPPHLPGAKASSTEWPLLEPGGPRLAHSCQKVTFGRSRGSPTRTELAQPRLPWHQCRTSTGLQPGAHSTGEAAEAGAEGCVCEARDQGWLLLPPNSSCCGHSSCWVAKHVSGKSCSLQGSKALPLMVPGQHTKMCRAGGDHSQGPKQCPETLPEAGPSRDPALPHAPPSSASCLRDAHH